MDENSISRPNRSSQNIIDGPSGPEGWALNNFCHVLEILFLALSKKKKTKTNISIFTSYIMQNIIFIPDLSELIEYIFLLVNEIRLYYSNP